MDSQDRSLKALYATALRNKEALDTLDPTKDDHRRALSKAVKALEECGELISSMALYSTNEEVDDISTVNLQYLVVDYMLAELLLRSYDANRMRQLQRASELLESFVIRLDHYDMLSTSERKLLEQYQMDRQSFSITSKANAEQRRNIKVARYQEEKALKSRLQSMRDQSKTNHVDDEIRRKLYLAEIALDVHQTFQSLDMISQELSILSQMRSTELRPDDRADEDNRWRQGRTDAYSERLDRPEIMAQARQRSGPLLDSKGKPLQPFTLTDKRTQLQNGVFRPGHNLPTMSIDEYLEEERKRGGIIEGGGNANVPQTQLDEDDMDLVDAATYKAREWDEFVEANPKGAGNTVNRG